MDLAQIRTCELVEELRGREGVDVAVIDPHSNIAITVGGPAVVLGVTD